MRFRKPQNTDSPRWSSGEAGKISWTKHSIEKMRFYILSENRIKRVLRNPDRKEEGIAPGTLAIMQRTGTKKHPTEIWVMYQKISSKSQAPNLKPKEKIRIISAWRYPGISPKGKEIPIPQDILEELNKII